MWPNPEDTADLVTFTEEIFNAKIVCFIDLKEIDFQSFT